MMLADAFGNSAVWLRTPKRNSPAVLIFSELAQANHVMGSIQDVQFEPAPGILVILDAIALRRDWLGSQPDRSCDRRAIQSSVSNLLRSVDRRTALIITNANPNAALDWIGAVFGHLVLESFVAQDEPVRSLLEMSLMQFRVALAHNLENRLTL